VLLILSLSLITVSARPKKMQRISNGSWGGQHIHIDVDSKSATLAFDCAHGTIEGPLMADSKGRFSWKGTYSPEHGGPVRNEENDTGQAAVYTGSIKNQTMTLTVRLANQKEPLDTFVLTQGKTGRIRKCL
jgi:hypothetical protein